MPPAKRNAEGLLCDAHPFELKIFSRDRQGNVKDVRGCLFNGAPFPSVLYIPTVKTAVPGPSCSAYCETELVVLRPCLQTPDLTPISPHPTPSSISHTVPPTTPPPLPSPPSQKPSSPPPTSPQPPPSSTPPPPPHPPPPPTQSNPPTPHLESPRPSPP